MYVFDFSCATRVFLNETYNFLSITDFLMHKEGLT